MSKGLNRNHRDFSRYDSMKTEELEKILQSDAESPEEQDVELLLYVTGLLAARGHGGRTAPEAYASFREHYMPEAAQMGGRRKNRRWIGGVAAALALVVGMSLSAQALGVDLWAVVATWTKDTFSFSYGGQETQGADQRDYDSLEAALVDCGRDAGLVPRWIPDSMASSGAQYRRTEVQEIFSAAYSGNGRTVRVTIAYYVNEAPGAISPSGDLVERISRNGTAYFYFAEEEGVRAAWIYGAYACEIAGDITMEQLKAMVDSVELDGYPAS